MYFPKKNVTLQPHKDGYMGRRDYEIAFVGLQPGIHEFEYQVDDKFFEAYHEQDFTDCKAVIKLTLEKANSLMLLKFEVDGTVKTNCDRCGNDLLLTLWDEFKIIVKLTENAEKMNEEEEDADVYYVERTESILHLKDWIYEFITLSVPMQKICENDDEGNSKCNKKTLDLLKNLEQNDTNLKQNIWKDLDKFKDLEN